MTISRREFSASVLAAAAAGAMPRVAGAAEGGKTIALMFDAFDFDFWITGNTILKAKAKENGWTTLETISNRDQNKQNDQVKAMVERKVDGIIFIPTDNNAAIPAIRTANAANIPIIFFNRPPAPNDNKYVAIQADNRKIMQNTVTILVDLARKQGGKYKACLLMGDLGDNNAVQRRDGALDILDKNKDLVEVVSRVATEWNADKTFAGLTNAIQANPDINMLISPSDWRTRSSSRCSRPPESGTRPERRGTYCLLASTATRTATNCSARSTWTSTECRTSSLRSTSPTERSRTFGLASRRTRCSSTRDLPSVRRRWTPSATTCGAITCGRRRINNR